ncbi:MAG: hypothetical protein ACREMI_03995 [Gemmatimonadales bacterium]
MKRLLGLGILALMCLGVSCGGDGPTNNGPGDLILRLTAPAGSADSAIVFTISGPAALTDVTPGAGLRLFQQPLGGTTTRFALTGMLTNGATILTIGVTDISEVGQYSGSIGGVAQANYQLRGLAGYALAVTR